VKPAKMQVSRKNAEVRRAAPSMLVSAPGSEACDGGAHLKRTGADPGCGSMARRTCGRESGSHMRWRGGLQKVRCMAGVAVRRCAFVSGAGMTGLAIQGGVSTGKGESSELLMRESCPQPTILGMAGVTGRRKVQRHMIGIRCALELRQMAGRTIWQDAILPPNQGLMTGFAFHRRVSANQREKILMVANLRPGCEPALHDVALGAIRAKFAQVNVCVAI